MFPSLKYKLYENGSFISFVNCYISSIYSSAWQKLAMLNKYLLNEYANTEAAYIYFSF